MSRRRGSSMALARIHGLKTQYQDDVLSVDTLAACDNSMLRWRQLCPFHVWSSAAVLVPGRPDLRSRSVEAVWQGLKLVDGQLALDQLGSTPHKRPPDEGRGAGYCYEDSAFMLDERRLDLLTARYLIYLPTYLHMLDTLVDVDLLACIDDWLTSGRGVAFYDWDSNMDIDDPRGSFSHSALLARWFNGTLGPALERAHDLASSLGLPSPARPARYFERPVEEESLW